MIGTVGGQTIVGRARCCGQAHSGRSFQHAHQDPSSFECSSPLSSCLIWRDRILRVPTSPISCIALSPSNSYGLSCASSLCFLFSSSSSSAFRCRQGWFSSDKMCSAFTVVARLILRYLLHSKTANKTNTLRKTCQDQSLLASLVHGTVAEVWVVLRQVR